MATLTPPTSHGGDTNNQPVTARKGGTEDSRAEGAVISKLLPSDIVMGRGVSTHPGNVHFREPIQTSSNAYNQTGLNDKKHMIAQQIVDEITKQQPQNGRFVRKLGTERWILVEPYVVLDKVKQALRDKERATRTHKPPARRLKTTPRCTLNGKCFSTSEQELQFWRGQQQLGVCHADAVASTMLPAQALLMHQHHERMRQREVRQLRHVLEVERQKQLAIARYRTADILTQLAGLSSSYKTPSALPVDTNSSHKCKRVYGLFGHTNAAPR